MAAAISAAIVVSPQPAQAAAAYQRGEWVAGVGRAQVGDPYVYGAAGPNAFDCSGLVKYAYARAVGRWLPHSADGIARKGRWIPAKYARPGDVAYWVDRTGYAYHVGIVVARWPIRIVDAPYAGRDVTVRYPWSGVQYRRLID